jgi:CheY-like chemotaxis protein
VTLRGEDVMNLVDSFHPDLILLDIMLGAMDGREIAKELKDGEHTKSIPIIMISANHTMAKDIEQYGVDTFVPKPFSSAHLLQTIQKYCPVEATA